MKTISKLAVSACAILMVFSCKQTHNLNENSADESVLTEEKSTDPQKLENVISSAAAVVKKDSKRKFIRTADVKFKVKNVAKSTYKIENAVTNSGGIVVNTNLQSVVQNRYSTKISSDSLVETTKYIVENNITLRIPNTTLDTVMKSIAKEVAYLDYRIIKADDVALKLLSNELSQNRLENHSKRLENDVDKKGKKLDDINIVENNNLDSQQQKDNAMIENLSLNDQVSFSTVTLALYQNESLLQETVAVEKAGGDSGNFGLEIIDGLKTGWYILARIFAFVIQLWSVVLMAFIGMYVYRKFVRKSKTALS